jgi:hypothetical protein
MCRILGRFRQLATLGPRPEPRPNGKTFLEAIDSGETYMGISLARCKCADCPKSRDRMAAERERNEHP